MIGGKIVTLFLKGSERALIKNEIGRKKLVEIFFFGHFSNFKRDCHVVRPCNILVFPFGIFQKMFFSK